jgi:hypothetical protein
MGRGRLPRLLRIQGGQLGEEMFAIQVVRQDAACGVDQERGGDGSDMVEGGDRTLPPPDIGKLRPGNAQPDDGIEP